MSQFNSIHKYVTAPLYPEICHNFTISAMLPELYLTDHFQFAKNLLFVHKLCKALAEYTMYTFNAPGFNYIMFDDITLAWWSQINALVSQIITLNSTIFYGETIEKYIKCLTITSQITNCYIWTQSQQTTRMSKHTDGNHFILLAHGAVKYEVLP